MATSWHDDALHVLLQFVRAQESGDPYAFRFEPQDYILPTTGGGSPSARFDWVQGVRDDLAALRRPGCDPAVVQRVGERLRSFVKDAGWAQYEIQIEKAAAAGRPIFLTLRSSSAELYALPWELLTLKSGQYVGAIEGLLVRFEWPETSSAQPEPTPPPAGGRILFAWSAAGGAVPAAEHLEALRAACTAGFLPFNSGLEAVPAVASGRPSRPGTEVLPRDASGPSGRAGADVLAQASLGRIVDTLAEAHRTSQPIAVLHLLCHGAAAGSSFGLVLDGDAGPVVADAAQLRDQLAPFAKMVRLIVLCACESGNQGTLGNQLGSIAQTLHRCGFRSVIASRFPLSVAGSVTLTEKFYSELLEGPASLETAFLAARKRLASSDANQPCDLRWLDWASLQLYARHEDGDDTRPVVFRPFRGLLAFQPKHRRFFFGRDAEVNEILHDLKALVAGKKERFLIVAGASGTGKSSLVFAGAVPKLLAAMPQLAFLRMRPGTEPERALDEALAKRPASAPALLVVDQFEEIFTQTADPAVRDSFMRRLWSLASSTESDLCVIVTLRVDSIGRCGELTVNDTGLRFDQIAYDEAYRVFVAQFHPQQLRASIVEPARKVGLELQAGLTERLLQDVGNEPGMLPLLEDAMDGLWQRRDGRLLTQTAYEAMGGVIGALQKRADAVVDKLFESDLAIARRVLISLVAVAEDTALDTRLRVSIAELQHSFSAADATGFERVLHELVSARLLVREDHEQTASVEVAHEALIRKWPKLRAWIDEDRAGLLVRRRVRRAAMQWDRQNRDESLLYRGGQLIHASDWRMSWESRLSDVERQFLDASDEVRVRLAQREAMQRIRERELAQQTRLAAVVLGLLSIIMTGTCVQAYRESVEANQKSVEAKQNAIEAREGLMVAIAQTFNADCTVAATILREVGRQDTRLWTQSALDVLQGDIAETVLRGHEFTVFSVAFSPDGTKIATGSWDKTARIWNADGSGVPVVLKGHESAVTAVAFSPDGTKIATGSWDKTVRIWNADGSGAPVVLKGHESAVTGVAFSLDGKKVVTGSNDKTARLWNIDSSGAATIFQGFAAAVTSVAVSPNGKKIVTGLEDHTARIWNTDGSGAPVVLEGHESEITSVAFSTDGKKVVTGSRDHTARLWNADGSGKPVVLTGHRRPVVSVAFSPEGKQIATGSLDRTIQIWNGDGSLESFFIATHNSDILTVAFSPDGKKIVASFADKTARIWSIASIKKNFQIHYEAKIYSVAFSPDGKSIITGLGDGSARIWNPGVQGTTVFLNGHQSEVRSVAFSPDGKKVVTGSNDHTARIWDADGSGEPLILSSHGSNVQAVAFSPDGRKVVTGSDDGTAHIWNADGSGKPLILKAGQVVRSVAFSPDGTKVATAFKRYNVAIWNADGSGEPLILKGHDHPVYAVAFSPDGKKVATGSLDYTARIWNADGSGQPVVLKGHEKELWSIAFSPDGKQVVTGSLDQTARIWNADGSGAPVILKGHHDMVTAVAFSPDGKRIITGSTDETARIWAVASDALLAELWNATTDCLPIDHRHELLLEPLANAKQGYERCRQEVARRRGWPTP